MESKKPCCTPSAESRVDDSTFKDVGVSENAGKKMGMVELKGGVFRMGAEGPETWVADGEGPVRDVEVSPFWIDRTCVTNADWADFVEKTGYQSEAERFGWSFVFLNQIPKAHRKNAQLVTVQGLNWWARIDKADWQKPGGPGTNIRKMMDHPVVHVSWNDAAIYAKWAGKRLPTEIEWEFAARGGLDQARYPWGDELTPGGKHRCNIWQGKFPENDTGEDGYTSTAPAKSFRANDFGLYNVSGNVWEWCEDRFGVPAGRSTGKNRVIRGGSFLCHDSYCNRYRVAARSSNTPDSSTCHTGFRCVI